MIELISAYLLQHKSISLPGLGTIYLERIPAQSDFVNRQLLPPAYHYRFDKYFDTPAKEFFMYLAASRQVEEYQAIKLFNEWSQDLRNHIGIEQPVALEGMGMLTRNTSGEIVFEPFAAVKTFEVAVPAERVIRMNTGHTMLVGDREMSSLEMSDYLQGNVRRKRASWWVYALILTALSLAAIFFHYYKNGFSAPFGNQQTVPSK